MEERFEAGGQKQKQTERKEEMGSGGRRLATAPWTLALVERGEDIHERLCKSMI